ncbi:predicted protein [Histoplasma capsulatum var. duboisii H88]|uniref:Predicted protein n=1 Tax=Ajellomyces capsulatus (strain H88) TaxID=544711 RepID=F0UM45_AJEC8|nr:predicted protein [Histoplasma capsulatum var. duboisii H88]
MESVTIVLKPSNTSTTPTEKANLEIEKAKLEIKRAELDIEKQKITVEKEKVAVEKIKLNIETTKLAVQMYEMTRNFENVIEHLIKFAKVEMSNNEFNDSDNDDDKLTATSAINSLLFFSNLPTPVGALSPWMFENITESTFKCMVLNHPETSTLKHHMVDGSAFQTMANPQTPIHKFSDVVGDDSGEWDVF